jgi:hypothetical protein
MNTLSPMLNRQQHIDTHTSAQSFSKTKSRNVIAKVLVKCEISREKCEISPKFANRVALVSGDNGNYQVAIIHREEAQRLYNSNKARIPEGYHRRRNIAKLFLQDHFPKFEKPKHTNSSKTTYTQCFVVTPGSQSPRFASGRSIMGIVIQHKPIDASLKDLYSVRQVG